MHGIQIDLRKLQESILQHIDVDAVKKNGEIAAGPVMLLNEGLGLFSLGLSVSRAYLSGGDLRKKKNQWLRTAYREAFSSQTHLEVYRSCRHSFSAKEHPQAAIAPKDPEDD